MKFQDLLNLYIKKKEQYGDKAYLHISELLRKAKELHKKDWEKNPTPNKDHEQSWRSFKGKNLEKLIIYIIEDEVEQLGLKIINGNKLERTKTENLSEGLNKVKRSLLVDYGEFGAHLPDVDIVIYHPQNYKILAVISSKVTLRERIAQTGYWKIKLGKDSVTKHIKFFIITPDEHKTLSIRKPAKKGRAIIELDLDGGYIMNEEKIEEDRRWDGLHGVITNDKKSTALDLLTRYRRLWVIEESFRINKHTLSMRPIYHFTPNRIKAHVLICYLAFAITRYAQQKINIFDETISIEKMRASLSEIEATIFEDKTTGHFYKVPSAIGKEGAMIYRAMGIQRPDRPGKYTLKEKCSVTKKT